MNQDIVYLPSAANLHNILSGIANANVPSVFNLDFLKDLGFRSSNHRPLPKLLRYLGFIDSSNKPLEPYRQFVNPTQSSQVLAMQLKVAYDDLLNAHPDAHEWRSKDLMGWFKTKTGKSEAVAKKMATTFKSLASFADFQAATAPEDPAPRREEPEAPRDKEPLERPPADPFTPLHLTYRVEINLPDTTDLRTFRAIFRALREELLS